MREKLIELLNDCQAKGFWSYGTDCKTGEHGGHEMTAEDIADYLVENIASKWISVKDRLPEKNTSVLASTNNGIVFQCLYAYDGWDLWDGNEVNITHWQPMPQPPKGE